MMIRREPEAMNCQYELRRSLIKNSILYLHNNRVRILRLSREAGWIMVGQVASVLGALALVRVLTEYLEPIAYGQLALALTLATLVGQVAMGGVAAAIGRFYSIAAEKDDLSGYLRDSRHLMGYAILAVGVIAAIVVCGLLAVGKLGWLGLAAAVLVLSVLAGLNSAFSAIQNAARQRAIVALHSGMDAWLKIGLALGAIMWLGGSSAAVVVGYAMSALLVTGSQLLFLRRLLQRHGSTNHSENWAGQMWLFSWPMMASGLFNWGYYASQRWALELFVTTAEVGKFFALTQIAYTPIVLAGSLFLSFITPILYSRAGDPGNHSSIVHVRKIVLKMAGLGVGLTLTLCVISVVFHELIFSFFVSEIYREYSSFMPLVILSAGILQSSIALGSFMTTLNLTKSILPLAIIGQSIIIVLNMLFTKFYGVHGLLYSMVGGACLHFVWMYSLVLKHWKSKL
jgi:O-antigen/teichoic acid export membrane protein